MLCFFVLSVPMRARKAVRGLELLEVVEDVEVDALLLVEIRGALGTPMESECEPKEMLCWAKRTE